MATSNQDDEQLRLLSIAHYVVACLAGLFALFPLFHLVVGLGVIAAGTFGDKKEALPAAFMGLFFVAFAVIWMALGFTLAGCLAAAGRFLAERRRYVFCVVVAGVACAFSPFGTVLGVFTLIVLFRDSVRVAFGREPAAPATPQGSPPSPPAS